jgi:hypothetical protein
MNLNDSDLLKGTEKLTPLQRKNCKNCQNKNCDQAYSGHDKQKMSLNIEEFWKKAKLREKYNVQGK